MAGGTVRISAATKETLRRLAAKSGEKMTAVLDKAVEAYRRQQFLEEANAAFAELRNDSRGWAEEKEERATWDSALSDGLDE